MAAPDIRNWLPEFKVSAEADLDLLRYFVKTPYFYQILQEKRWLVLGRKGTGKTSIFQFLRKYGSVFSERSSTVALNFKDYPWPIHKLYKEEMEGELTAYQKSWHYLFITQALSNLIYTNERNGVSLSSDLKRAKVVLEKVFGSPFPTLLESVKSKLFRIDNFSLPSIETDGFAAKLSEISFEKLSHDKLLQERLRSNSFSLCEYFEKVLFNNIDGNEIVLLLDHLDESWLPDQLEEYAKILINLLSSAAYINSSPRYLGKLRIVIFLRSDIFETLQFNDKNKLSQDTGVHIVWDKDSLDEMFFERIKLYCPAGVKLDHSRKSSAVFEVKRVRQGSTPFLHILKRTFYRPRDVIVYFNKLRTVHRKNNSGLYTSKNLYEAEQLVSDHLHGELMDEWLAQKPELRDMLAALQSIGSETFRFKDFASRFLHIRPGTRSEQIQEAIRFLYSNSIIGQKHGSSWEFQCTRPFLQLDFEKDFKVAAGLTSRLNLREKRARRNGNGNGKTQSSST